jgi:glucose/arabinose dehydrogenase
MRRLHLFSVFALALSACSPAPPAGEAAPAASPAPAPAPPPAPAARPACDAGNGGITLPPGFCAVVVADSVGRARHVAVAPNGDVYVALASRRGQPGGVLALRDTTGDGRADVRVRFGEEGGTGIAIRDGFLYFAHDEQVDRYRLVPGELRPAGPETVVSGLPGSGGHAAKSVALDGQGGMFVNVGSLSNACQVQDRALQSPGHDPCTELRTRAGIWRFEANRTGQTFRDGVRWATGIRNALALDVSPEGQLHAVQHGRDQLHQNWPKLFTAEQGAEKPAEEFFRVEEGGDYGWPYCYYDPELRRKVLAPEYGGDGQKVGRCAEKRDPLLAFPAHWAPEALLFYTGRQFPERYRGGAFISFHGSWNRAPLPQAGFQVVYVPFQGGAPAGAYQTFAEGFAGEEARPENPRNARHRPMGLAQGPDGSLYITDDHGGRIWRVLYTAR